MTSHLFAAEALEIVVEEMPEDQLYVNAGINSCASTTMSLGTAGGCFGCFGTIGTAISCSDEQAIN